MHYKYSKAQLVIISILILNLITTGILMGITLENSRKDSAQEKYVLYIGTNDKDTYKQEIPYEECKSLVKAVCTRYVSGFTIADAVGVWTDETGRLSSENTMICYFNDAEEDTITAIADEIMERLNQSSVLIECQNLNYYFYSKQQ